MQRLIEQLVAEGVVLDGGGRRWLVHYHLDVYQHFSDKPGEPTPSHVEVEGRIAALDGLDIAELRRTGRELTLQLADGRALDFRVTQADGTIHSTGRGLQHSE